MGRSVPVAIVPSELTTTAANVGVPLEEKQYELIHRLEDHGILNRELARLFIDFRRVGNDANHAFTGNHSTVLSILKICWQLGVWFHRTFKVSHYETAPFIPPRPPHDETAELKSELERLQQELEANKSEFSIAQEQLGEVDVTGSGTVVRVTVWRGHQVPGIGFRLFDHQPSREESRRRWRPTRDAVFLAPYPALPFGTKPVYSTAIPAGWSRDEDVTENGKEAAGYGRH